MRRHRPAHRACPSDRFEAMTRVNTDRRWYKSRERLSAKLTVHSLSKPQLSRSIRSQEWPGPSPEHRYGSKTVHGTQRAAMTNWPACAQAVPSLRLRSSRMICGPAIRGSVRSCIGDVPCRVLSHFERLLPLQKATKNPASIVLCKTESRQMNKPVIENDFRKICTAGSFSVNTKNSRK